MKSISNESPQQSPGPQSLVIQVDTARRVSGLLQSTPGTRACYVLAHGAGAGMQHAFLGRVAAGLSERSVGTLRYQFPYMEQGSKRPDTPPVAQAAVRAAIAEVAARAPELALFAGGKSFGGRMTSQAQAASPLCIPRADYRMNERSIYRISKSPCCFFKGTGTNSRICHYCNPSRSGLVNVRH